MYSFFFIKSLTLNLNSYNRVLMKNSEFMNLRLAIGLKNSYIIV